MRIQLRWKKLLFGLAAIAGLAFMSSPASAKCTLGDCWGAVAYGPGISAYEINLNDKETAKELAMAKCKEKCTQVLTFHNTCGAYVAGNGGHGWGTSRNKDTAVGAAMMECQKVAKNCELRVWACTAEKK